MLVCSVSDCNGSGVQRTLPLWINPSSSVHADLPCAVVVSRTINMDAADPHPQKEVGGGGGGEARRRRTVVVDCDPGMDDLQAIAMLVSAEERGELHLAAVTTVAGNVTVRNSTRNARRLLGLLGRTDIPIYRGAHSSLLEGRRHGQDFWHGRNGLGDQLFDTPLPRVKHQDEMAAVALVRLAREHKGELNIVAVGPLTNLALAIRLDEHFVSNINDIYIMGGNYQGLGNATPSGEFNFFSDPESASIVLTSVKRPAIICTWEVCLLHGLPMEWRREVLGTSGTPLAEFFNTVEYHALARAAKGEVGMFNKQWVPCDQLAAAVFIRPEMVLKQTRHHAAVETRGHLTHGQMVVDRRGWQAPYEQCPDKLNILLVEQCDMQLYKSLLLDAFGHKDVQL